MDSKASVRPVPKSEQGIIYLLHFERPYKHARHYLGWTQDLESRLIYHLNGRGAMLLDAVARAGIKVAVVRTWLGTRSNERSKHNRGHARRCPVCRGEIEIDWNTVQDFVVINDRRQPCGAQES